HRQEGAVLEGLDGQTRAPVGAARRGVPLLVPGQKVAQPLEARIEGHDESPREKGSPCATFRLVTWDVAGPAGLPAPRCAGGGAARVSGGRTAGGARRAWPRERLWLWTAIR